MALADGLVGYWSPWLGSSGYRLLDRTRYANHGTLTNMDAGADWVGAAIQGRSGCALDFDGTNDYVTTTVSLASKTQVGISLWYWRSSSSHNFYCGAGLGTAAGPRANIYLFGGTLYMTAENTGNAFLSTSVGTTGWMHIFYRYNGNAASQFVRLLPYVNGNLLSFNIANTFPTSLGNVGNFEIGRTLGENAYGTGRVAESCLWFRDLQESEIRELYRLGPGWYRPYAKRSIGYPIAGFKAYWHRRQSQIIGGGLK